ncbi:hypothetical protein ABIA39_003695 [Nocardia sp. GAS34]|uniref:DUF7373 family lipoprotein n=1 Tax=unclassified Nocardia TaxID=2637762 RepID=UPI003D21239B
MRRAKVLLAIGLAAAIAAGCGSGSSHAPSARPVDVSKLDVAGYNTDLVTIGKQDLERAKVSEAQRLASVLPLAMDIDPRFKYQDGTNPASVYGFSEDAAGSGLATQNINTDAPGFVAGFSVNGETDQNISLATYFDYSVLIFTDSTEAGAGARSLAAKKFSKSMPNQPANIDGHPDAQTIWRSEDDTIDSFIASDRYVIYVSAADNPMLSIGSPNLPELTTLTKKTIEAVSIALKSFEPTPVDQLTDIQPDYDGLIGRAIPKTLDDLGRSPAGIYDQHGALILSDNAAADKELYARTGMDRMATNAGRLYRTRDSATAETLFEARSTLKSKLYKNADSPKNLPEARCDEYRGDNEYTPRFHCAVAYGCYAAEIWSNQLLDTQQRISAQYVLMTR